MERITPVLVVGSNRSGTKWLSNILCAHPQVAGVHAERFGGIVETNIFDALSRSVPDLARVDDYVALVELWSRTDFFRIAGAEAGLLYRLEPRPRDHSSLFRALMDDMARREGKSHWLQKTDPWQAYRLLGAFHDAHFVVIERDTAETLRSLHYMRSRGRERLRIKTILGYLLQQKVLRRVRERSLACAVRFDRLKADPAREMERVCRHLGIPFDPGMLEPGYRPNTSFRKEKDREYDFTAAERLKIRLASAMARVLPFPLLSLGRSLFGARELHYVKGTFASVKSRYGLD